MIGALARVQLNQRPPLSQVRKNTDQNHFKSPFQQKKPAPALTPNFKTSQTSLNKKNPFLKEIAYVPFKARPVPASNYQRPSKLRMAQ